MYLFLLIYRAIMCNVDDHVHVNGFLQMSLSHRKVIEYKQTILR